MMLSKFMLSSLFVSISIGEEFNGWEERVVAPPRWPETFHAKILQTRKGLVSLMDLYYDFPNGRYLNVLTDQLDRISLHDNGRTNGTAYFYDQEGITCEGVKTHVSILKPDWLGGATYAGLHEVGGFEVDCWQQGRAPPPHPATNPFLTYCSTKTANREPVRWVFYDGSSFDVMSWNIGVTPPSDLSWDIPPVCFVDSGLAPWEGGSGGWSKVHLRPSNTLNSNPNKPPSGFQGSSLKKKSQQVNTEHEGGQALAAKVHAARGPLPAEGETTNIVTTIKNEKLMLAAMSAAVEYQRRMLIDPHLKRKKKATKLVKIGKEKPKHIDKPHHQNGENEEQEEEI